jgi:FkbM family methyltransferase
MKKFIKSLIKKLPFDFTANQKYDRQTAAVIKKACKPDSNTIDVGCHKGEILQLLLKAAPDGTHFCFEPIPDLCAGLRKNYQEDPRVVIHEIALSKAKGETSFNYVISNPAYSGIRKRKYDKAGEVDTQITVQTDLLDNLIPENIQIDFIKIDVEGAELFVLEGAINTIRRCKPVIVFEHGLGASEFYDATPEKVYMLLTSCGLHIALMESWLLNGNYLTLEAFSEQYYQRKNYVFIAY